jgi:carbonic anhydrase
VIDPSDFLPAQKDYYTYMGSLTTPPCTEGVLWMVMKQPMQAAPAQMALFSRLYPMNARPIQSSAGRVIKESL